MHVRATSKKTKVHNHFVPLFRNRFKKRLRNDAAENKIKRSKRGHKNSMAPELATKQTS